MRKLTFKGFLEAYIQQLSRQDGCNIRKLATEAATENPRLREPLVLYACITGKAHLLAAAQLSDYPAVLRSKGDQVEELLKTSPESLPTEYQKVWNSYQSVANRKAGEAQTKQLMRKKILKLQKEKSISNYRLYTALHLNHGNMNAWLKNDDPSKISLDTARQILHYAMGV